MQGYNRKESNWYSFDVCVECNSRFFGNDKYLSNAVCPYCGHETKKQTICASRKVIAKKITYTHKWKFWDSKAEYIGKDKFSQDWLDNK